MYYLIDFDKRSVECKCEQSKPLEDYIKNNSLESALFIASEPGDIDMEMSLKEINELCANLQKDSEKARVFECSEDASNSAFAAITENIKNHPSYTVALGKRMLKSAGADIKPNELDKPDKAVKAVRKATNKAASGSGKLKRDDVLSVTEKCNARKNTILEAIVRAIDEELCETVQDIIDYLVANFTRSSGKATDEKHALHNIQHFTNRGDLMVNEL